MMKSVVRALLVSSMLASPGLAQADAFNDALKSAYENNPRIQAQRRTLEQSNERVSQAIGNFRPEVSATYENGRQRTRFDGSEWSYGDTEVRQLSFQQPLFLGGQNIFGYSSAKNQMLSGRADLMTQEQEVLLDAVIAYMDVVQNESVLRLSENNESVLARQLEASQNRFEVGDVTRTDVAQSEARLARAQSDTIQARGDLESAIANFERVIGYKPENLPLPVPGEFPQLPRTLEDAIEFALTNNPSVTSAKYLQESAEDSVAQNVGGLLPQVSLVGRMSRDDGAGSFGTSEFDNDSITVNVTMPIYQQGNQYSRVREAKLINKRREFEKENTEDAVRESVIQAWENLQTAISTIEAQEQNIRAAEIALDGVRQEQQYGARTVLDVLDAEQELFVAKVNLVRAQRNRVVSIFNLLLVLGQMDIRTLNVDAEPYDPETHYDDVKWQLIGF